MSNPFASIADAIADIKAGKMVILVDDEDRENEGDLVMAAEAITPEAINFMATHARGLICLPMDAEYIDKLELPMMADKNASKYETAFTVSIEAREGVTTGISAADRAQTIRVAVADGTSAADIITPGHIFPLRAKTGGVLIRQGQTEGSVDLSKLAGFKGAGVICEIMNDDGSMARLPDLQKFAARFDLKIVSINDLIAYRMLHDSVVVELANARLPIAGLGEFTVKVFGDKFSDVQHVAVIKGEIDPETPTLVRVHSECLTGDVFGSDRCDCGPQLKAALKQIKDNNGVLLYMSQEGRGIGLANKIKAYALQDQGLDTVEANKHLGFAEDHRDYGIGSQILRELGIRQMRLMTNNPRKIIGLEGFGLEIVERVAIETGSTQGNAAYLTTKRDKLGHLLNLTEEA